MSKFIANSFQVPNAVIDELMADMSANALRCYLLITRKTTGWGKESDKISISQFMQTLGVKDKRTVYVALTELINLNLINAIKNNGGITEYSLVQEASEPVTKNAGTKNVTGNKKCTEPVAENVPTTSNKKCTSTKDNIKNTIQNNIYKCQNSHHFDVIWDAGLPKVNKSKAIKSFESAFKKWKQGNPSKTMGDFSMMIANDIKKRLEINQFGFEKLHPTTYLNNQRWEDEINPQAIVREDKSSKTDWINDLNEEVFQ